MNLNYDIPYKFTGKIEEVTIDLEPAQTTAADKDIKRKQEAIIALQQ